MAQDANQAAQAWTDYWRSGEGASCHRGGAGEVSFESVWTPYFQGLRGVDVLDLATGNGAVLRRALVNHSDAKPSRLRVTGVDYAEITPSADLGRARMLGGVRLESLPFPNASFDAVTSQFGFEYADEERAAAEAARVLRNDGVIRLVVHARHGEVSRDIGERAARLVDVLRDGEILLRLRNLARGRAAGLPETPDALAQVNLAWARVQALKADAPNDDAALFYAEGIANLWNNRARYDAKDLLRSIEDGIARAQAVQLRQEAMLAAARSADDMEALRARFAALNVSTERAQPINDDQGRQIAWLLDGKKQ
jgi:SAM-dependent methyltransferase